MYHFLFRTVFVRLDAERAHHLIAPLIRLAGWRPFRWVLRLFTAPAAERAVTALGMRWESPFGVAAGFDKNAVLVMGLYALGFGHIEVGTVTARPQPGNPRPRLFRLVADRALINRMGFNNDGAEVVARRLRVLRRKKRRPIVGINIGKSRVVPVEEAVADYVRSAQVLAPVADYLVVNVSSPNTPGLRGLQNVDTLRELLSAVQQAANGTPLLVKIAPDLPDDQVVALAELAVQCGLAGIVATNTTIARDGLRTSPEVVAAAGEGGLSGDPVRGRSREVLEVIRQAVGDQLCIVSVGGVDTATELRKRVRAGANLVQGYTGFIYHGPFWARAITRR